MADSSTQPRLPPVPGSGTTRGSERGACTMASSLSRSKASLPSRRTMKFRLLFWMRGKGRAGSSPRGLKTGSTSCSKYSSSHARVCGLQSAGPSSGTPSAARRGRSMLVQAAVLRVDQARGTLVDGLELLGDRHAVGGQLAAAELLQLLQARDADLEELIEVAAGDAQELQPLEQRHPGVEGLIEHALVELQEREFAVDVVLGRLEVRRIHESAASSVRRGRLTAPWYQRRGVRDCYGRP